MNEDQSVAERLAELWWPRDLAELSVFGFISLTGAALLGGILNQILFR